MGLFFKDIPPSVNFRELHKVGGVYGRMKFGEGRLRPAQVPLFKAIVEGAMMNNDHFKGANWKGRIMPDEIDHIGQQLKMTGRFSDKQIAKAVGHLKDKI